MLDRSGRVYEVTVGAEQRPERHQVLDTMWNCAQGRRGPASKWPRCYGRVRRWVAGMSR